MRYSKPDGGKLPPTRVRISCLPDLKPVNFQQSRASNSNATSQPEMDLVQDFIPFLLINILV